MLRNRPFVMDAVYSIPSPFPAVITFYKKSPNIYAPTNNQRSFLLLSLIIPLPLPTPAAPTARVVAGPMVTRSMRALPTMRFLLHLILELASRDSTTYHSQYAMVSHLVSCKASSQTTCDGPA